MQATEWAQIKNTWDVERVAVVDDNNNIIAATQILTKKGFWYAPRGPIMDYDNKELVSFFLENLKNKKILIMGCGVIGGAAAKILKRFGVKF